MTQVAKHARIHQARKWVDTSLSDDSARSSAVLNVETQTVICLWQQAQSASMLITQILTSDTHAELPRNPQHFERHCQKAVTRQALLPAFTYLHSLANWQERRGQPANLYLLTHQTVAASGSST